MSAPSMTAREWGMLVTLSIVWGASFFFNDVAAAELPVFTVAAARVGLAAVILVIVLRAIGVALPPDWRIWAAFFAMGLLNNAIPFSLIIWGQSQIESGVASMLNATTPVFTVLVAHAFTVDEKLTPARLIGVVLGLFGVAAMMGGEVVSALGADVLAQGACVAAAVSYAFAGVFGRRFRAMGVAPMATATGQLVCSSLILVPLALALNGWPATPSIGAVGSLIGIATLSTAFAYVLYFRILATAGATNLLLVTLLAPVTAVLLGSTILGERLETAHILGSTLIALGLVAIDGRLIKRLRIKKSAAAYRDGAGI